MGAEGTNPVPHPGREPAPPACPLADLAQPGQPTTDTAAETRGGDFLPVLRAGGPTSRHCRGFSSGLTGGRLPLCVLTWPLAGSALSARDTGPLRPGPHPHGLIQPNQPRSPLSTRSPPGVRSELPHVSVEGTQFRPEQGEAPRPQHHWSQNAEARKHPARSRTHASAHQTGQVPLHGQERGDVPWPVWLSGLSVSLKTKGSLVRFPVRAHAWVVS